VEQAFRQFPNRQAGIDLIVLESGVSTAYLTALAAVDADVERANLGSGPGRPVISVIGRLSGEKGVDRIIQAFAAVVRDVPDAVLIIVGGGADEPSLRCLAAQLGLTNSVIFTGHQDDVVKYVAISAIGVLGSTVPETGPLALKELMAAGVPVVAPEIGGIPDFVRDGVNGWLYEVEAGLHPCLLRAIDSLTQGSTAGAEARRTIINEHRLSPRVDALESAILRTVIRKLDARSWLPELELDDFRIRPERDGGFIFMPRTSQLAEVDGVEYEKLEDLRRLGTRALSQWPEPQARAIAELLFDMGVLRPKVQRRAA